MYTNDNVRQYDHLYDCLQPELENFKASQFLVLHSDCGSYVI